MRRVPKALATGILLLGSGAGEVAAQVPDTIRAPHMAPIAHIQRSIGVVRAGFDGFVDQGTLFVPVIVLPHLFDVTMQWRAAEQTLRLRKEGGELRFRLGESLGVSFGGVATADLGEPLHHYQGMLYLPIRTLAEFFGMRASYDKGRRTLALLPRPPRPGPSTDPATPAPPPSRVEASWQQTLRDLGMDDYAGRLAEVEQGQRRFTRIWATSEEAQRTAGAGVRGDFYLRDTDLAGALPSRKALGKLVTVHYPKTGRKVTILICDVGPWNIADPYWHKTDGRPEVETTIYDRTGRKSNLAGIDISYETWTRLGVPREKAYAGMHSDYVDWWFAQ